MGLEAMMVMAVVLKVVVAVELKIVVWSDGGGGTMAVQC